MKRLLVKINFSKYGIIYVILLGALSYCFTVMHFAATYWDAPAVEHYATTLDALSDFRLDGEESLVVQDGESFRYSLSGTQYAMAHGSVPLEQGEYLSVSADISGTKGVTVYLDLFADGYDNPEQETALSLTGEPMHVEQRWSLGDIHPDFARFRVFAVAASPDSVNDVMVLENVRIAVESNGTMFAPVHLTCLFVGIFFGILFLIALIIYLSNREKKEFVIPNAEKGIVFGYLKLKLTPKLRSKSGVIEGQLIVTNKGKPVRNLSSGDYPVNIGISIVDENHVMVNQECGRLAIQKEGILHKGERIMLPVNLDNLQEYSGKNYQLAFTVVQERVAWDRSTAVYYPIP